MRAVVSDDLDPNWTVRLRRNGDYDIGCDSRCALRFGDVSDRHARIYWDKDSFWIHDFGSPRGTFLNERRIEKAPLGAGDVVRIGHQTIRIEATGEPLEDERSAPALLVVDGPRLGERFPLVGRTMLVGRAPRWVDIHLTDAFVSPVHCALCLVDDDLLTVIDCHSQAGTFLNDRRVELAEVRPRDSLRVGRSTMHFELASGFWQPV